MIQVCWNLALTGLCELSLAVNMKTKHFRVRPSLSQESKKKKKLGWITSCVRIGKQIEKTRLLCLRLKVRNYAFNGFLRISMQSALLPERATASPVKFSSNKYPWGHALTMCVRVCVRCAKWPTAWLEIETRKCIAINKQLKMHSHPSSPEKKWLVRCTPSFQTSFLELLQNQLSYYTFDVRTY